MNASAAPDLADRSLYRDWTRATLRYADLDPNDHVNNGAINQFFEEGRVGLRQARLGDLPAGALAGFAIVKFSATYRSILHYPGEVEVGTTILHVGRSSYSLGQAIFDGQRCIATAEVVTVHLDRQAGRAAPLPEAVRRVLEEVRDGG